ncbi:hypothetical protein P3H80_12170 [Mycolicibacterium septicum]|uniref:hypothetical protein n=1 Tax=Mycolicibacterium septicum TaxID=98668 RepID=UPI0023E0F167|nr:hypothetical protein [Mycolicibacterium septicum]MDF3338184.1 hypothetical protein [Mycolicibacterium septicum]
MTKTPPDWIEREDRRVAFTAYGPDSGMPVLFIAGAGCGRLMRFGEQDLENHRVHSPDLGITLADRISGASRTVIDGVGGALLWAYPDLVLRRLRT